jgi:hypothetical protein
MAGTLAADADEVGIVGVHPGACLRIMTVEALSHLRNHTSYRCFALVGRIMPSFFGEIFS